MQKSLGHPDFVYLNDADPSILSVPRYATKHNFTGKPMRGYERQVVVISKAMVKPLKAAQKRLSQLGYQLVVYDSYRPSKAVGFYLQFIEDNDFSTKELYFPFIKNKNDLLEIQYLARRCPHSRGASVDVSILKNGNKLLGVNQMNLKTIKLNNNKNIKYLDDGTQFMGTHFDFFDESSHWDTQLISQQAQKNRNILLQAMENSGFCSYQKEWWHFSLQNQPYPNKYFDFDIV